MTRSESQPESESESKHAGEEPDYRFTLANERTFLAYTRTSLALLAAAVGVVKLPGDNPTWLEKTLGVLLGALGLIVAAGAYWRYRTVQHAIRRGSPLPQTPALAITGGALTAIAVLALVLVIAS